METTVNTRVQVLKNELRLNTMDFCAKAKISNGTFHNIKSGENVNQKTLNTIIENLNVNPDWLLHGKGKMFNEAPKEASKSNNNDPWKDALVSQIKEENNSLKKELERVWQLLQHHMGGAKPNFLKASEYAYKTLVLPKGKTLAFVSGAKMH